MKRKNSDDEELESPTQKRQNDDLEKKLVTKYRRQENAYWIDRMEYEHGDRSRSPTPPDLLADDDVQRIKTNIHEQEDSSFASGESSESYENYYQTNEDSERYPDTDYKLYLKDVDMQCEGLPDGRYAVFETPLVSGDVFVYWGEMRDGWRHGYGHSFWTDGEIKYDGNWRYGNYHGLGELCRSNGLTEYDGEWLDGKFHGTGDYFDTDGDLYYSGQWVHGSMQGTGVLYRGDRSYEGEFYNDLFHGNGTLYDRDGHKLHTGQFLFGDRISIA
jgi:hypothetical protein